MPLDMVMIGVHWSRYFHSLSSVNTVFWRAQLSQIGHPGAFHKQLSLGQRPEENSFKSKSLVDLSY